MDDTTAAKTPRPVRKRPTAAKPSASGLPKSPTPTRKKAPVSAPDTPGSVASSTGSDRGLHRFVKKQLSLDIEALGGIKKLTGKVTGPQALSKLCDRDPLVYGNRGAPIRGQISSRVDYLKNLGKHPYAAHLQQLSLTPEIIAARRAELQQIDSVSQQEEATLAGSRSSLDISSSSSSSSTGETTFVLPSKEAANRIQKSKAVPEFIDIETTPSIPETTPEPPPTMSSNSSDRARVRDPCGKYTSRPHVRSELPAP